MSKDNNTKNGELFPIIEHAVGFAQIDQRANDGYVNATELCQVSGKLLAHYLANKTTKDFLIELSSDIGIPISGLVEVVKGGIPNLQGTWVHPQVAINLGQWASPKFAVLVSKWVFEWMSGRRADNYEFPYHIRRYMINRNKIPPTHFSMLDQFTLRLMASLEHKRYIIPDKLMPDISLGRMFSKVLREYGYKPEEFPTYTHVFDDGKRPSVDARLYPNGLITKFNLILEDWIRNGGALKYFKEKDPDAIAAIKEVIAELPPLIKKK